MENGGLGDWDINVTIPMLKKNFLFSSTRHSGFSGIVFLVFQKDGFPLSRE